MFFGRHARQVLQYGLRRGFAPCVLFYIFFRGPSVTSGGGIEPGAPGLLARYVYLILLVYADAARANLSMAWHPILRLIASVGEFSNRNYYSSDFVQ